MARVYQEGIRFYPSVTALLARLFKYMGPQVLNDDALRAGTAMHNAIEDRLKGRCQGKKYSAEVEADLVMFDAWRLAHKHFEYVWSEQAAYSTYFGIVGTPDALFYDTIHKHYVLVDWKRAKPMWQESYTKYGWQLRMYRKILQEFAPDQYIGRMLIVRIHPASDRAQTIDVPWEDPTSQIDEGLKLYHADLYKIYPSDYEMDSDGYESDGYESTPKPME
jgi:hypothetical protein